MMPMGLAMGPNGNRGSSAPDFEAVSSCRISGKRTSSSLLKWFSNSRLKKRNTFSSGASVLASARPRASRARADEPLHQRQFLPEIGVMPDDNVLHESIQAGSVPIGLLCPARV